MARTSGKFNDRRVRQAGQSTRKMAARRRSLGFTLLLIAFGGVLILIVLSSNLQTLGISGTSLLVIVLLFRVAISILDSNATRQFKAEDRAIRGAVAEEKIADLLNELGEDFHVLHDIASPYGNIDHIVLSKQSGVFLIETKAHGGKVEIIENNLLVNGRPPEKDFVAQALRNTYWLKEEFQRLAGADIWVTPLVVFTNAFVPSSPRVKGVLILNKCYLVTTLRRGRSDAAIVCLWDKRDEVSAVLAQDR